MGIPEVLRDYAPLAEDLLQQSGLPYRFSFYPAQRSFNALVSGEVDAEFSRTQSAFASDQSEFVMIGPIGCAEISAYRMTGSAASLGQVGDLANYRVAVLNGSIAVIKFLRKRHASLTLAVNGEALYRMLEAHHVDLVVDAPLQSIGAVKALHMQDRVEVTGPPVLTEPAFLILNSRFAAWRPKLQATLDGLKKSGQWQQHFGDINEKRGLPRNTAMSCLEH